MSTFNTNTFEGYLLKHADTMNYHLEEMLIQKVQQSLTAIERLADSGHHSEALIERYRAQKDLAEYITGKTLVVIEEVYLVQGFESR